MLLVLVQTPASGLTLEKTIEGDLAPKSIVHSGSGLFFAQNMMYRHTIAVYNRDFKLVKVIPDRVNLADFGYPYPGSFQGAPVEAAFSHGGKYAWVSNYMMSGDGFSRPGNDDCTPADNTDRSFIYKINTETLSIENVIKVGSVPKFIAVTPDNRRVLVTNWCSWDVSIIDAEKETTVRSVYIGHYPRGLAVNSDSSKAYIAVMGSNNVAVLDLANYKLSWIRGIGRSPRHLILSPDDKYLYATLNGEDKVAKVDVKTRRLVKKVGTGQRPRSMASSADGGCLYVVNYDSDTVSKVDTSTMTVVETVAVNRHPIGIAYDAETRKVWVACYSGTLMVFQD
jgi:YVTN family beta-propeller protein